MTGGRHSNPEADKVMTTVVTVLLGFIFIINASIPTAPMPLRVLDGVLAFVFMGAAIYETLKEEK